MSGKSEGKVCCVPSCPNTQKKNPGLTFYSFPNRDYDVKRKKLWIARVQREGAENGPWVPTKHTRICSDHFIGGIKSNHPAEENFNPTIFPWKPSNEYSEARRQRIACRSEKKNVNSTPDLKELAESAESPDLMEAGDRLPALPEKRFAMANINNLHGTDDLIDIKHEPLEEKYTSASIKQEPIDHNEVMFDNSVSIKQEPLDNNAAVIVDKYNTSETKSESIDNIMFEKCEIKSEFGIKNEPNLDLKNNNRCEDCSMTFSDALSLNIHLKTHRLDLFPCEVCPATFPRKYKLTAHSKTAHPDYKPHKCEQCNKSFRTLRYLKAHSQTMGQHSEPAMTCDLCKVTFPRKCDLLAHLKTHPDYRPHQCETCHKRFGTDKNLKAHLLTHSAELFECDLCSKQFNYIYLLHKHKVTHAAVKKHICVICQASFTRPSTLKCHLLLHAEQKPYPCTECEKGFVTKERLDRHMLIHLNIRKYVCDICDKRFHQKTVLKDHMVTHGTRVTYKCDGCDNTYFAINSLNKHKAREGH